MYTHLYGLSLPQKMEENLKQWFMRPVDLSCRVAEWFMNEYLSPDEPLFLISKRQVTFFGVVTGCYVYYPDKNQYYILIREEYLHTFELYKQYATVINITNKFTNPVN